MARGAAPPLRLIFTTTRRNLTELPDVIGLAGELGIGSVSVNGFEPYTVIDEGRAVLVAGSGSQ